MRIIKLTALSLFVKLQIAQVPFPKPTTTLQEWFEVLWCTNQLLEDYRQRKNLMLDQTSILLTLYLSKLRAVIKENTPLSSSPSTLTTLPTVVCPNIKSENPLISHCVSSR